MRVALIELGGSHDECLYSQVRFLRERGVKLTLIVSANLENAISLYGELEQVYLVDILNKRGLTQWKIVFQLWQYIQENQFDKVVFNTAHGNVLRKLMLFPFDKKIIFAGIAHNTKKLISSGSQRLISRKVKRYYLLSQGLLDNLPQDVRNQYQFSVFYPIYFPTFKEIPVHKKEGDIWICIPGQVQFKRRDYKTLLGLLEKEKLDNRIKFVLLGRATHSEYNDGEYVKNKVKELGLSARFLFWDDFIDYDTFHSYLKASDFVLPLAHPSSDEYEAYFKYKISGSFNLAYAYNKPLLMENTFKTVSEFTDDNSVFYAKEALVSILNQLVEKDGKCSYTDEKWQFSYQQEAYWKLLGH